MDHLSDITDYIKLLMASDHFQLLLVVGPPGWGKSSLTRKVLEDLSLDYRELGSYATPLGLYNGLVEDPDGLLIVDDCAGLFHNALSMSILNAATWPTRDGGPRAVKWTSSTDLAAAGSVDFEGKIIVLTNALPSMPQAQAFKSRALYYRLDIKKETIEQHLVLAAKAKGRFKNPKLAVEVAKFLGLQAEYHDSDQISLRTLRLGYELATVNKDRWQSLLLKALPNVQVDPRELLGELAGTGMKIEEQAGIFFQQTGLGRRRFFEIRKELGLTGPTGAKTESAAVQAKKKSGPKSKTQYAAGLN